MVITHVTLLLIDGQLLYSTPLWITVIIHTIHKLAM